MKKKVIAAACLLFTAASSSQLFAGGTRMAGMGLDSTSYWMIDKDTTLIDLNPAQASNYNPYVSLTVDNAGAKTIGTALIRPTDNFSLYYKSQTNTFDQQDTISPLSLAYQESNAQIDLTAANNLDSVSLATRQFDLIGSYKTGDGTAFGVHAALSLATDNKKEKANGTVTTDKQKMAYEAVIGGGVLFSKDFEAQAELTCYGVDYSYKTAADKLTYSSTLPFNIAAYVRYNLQSNEKNQLHIVGGGNFMFAPSEAKQKSTGDKDEYSRIGYGVYGGISDQIKISDNAFAFCGTRLAVTGINSEMKSKGTTPQKDTYSALGSTLPIIIGTEFQIADWLQARLGYSRLIFNSSASQLKTSAAGVSSSTDENTISQVATTTYAWGLSAKFGNLKIDALLAAYNDGGSLIGQGPYILTQQSSSIKGTLTKVAIGYSF